MVSPFNHDANDLVVGQSHRLNVRFLVRRGHDAAWVTNDDREGIVGDHVRVVADQDPAVDICEGG